MPSLDEMVEAYRERREQYEAFANSLRALTVDLLQTAGIVVHTITSRTKEVNSLAEKLRSKDKHYKELQSVTDLAGIRIITYFADDVDRVADVICKEVNPVDVVEALQWRTGYIERDEYAGTTGQIYMGDSSKNKIYRGYFTFNTGQFSGATVHKVELRLAEPQVFGDPGFMHGAPNQKPRGLWIEVVVWGNRQLLLTDYSLRGHTVGSSLDYDITRTSVIGGSSPALAESLQTYIDAGYTQFQLRLRFDREISNNNNAFDAVLYLWQNITLKVWYE